VSLSVVGQKVNLDSGLERGKNILGISDPDTLLIGIHKFKLLDSDPHLHSERDSRYRFSKKTFILRKVT